MKNEVTHLAVVSLFHMHESQQVSVLFVQSMGSKYIALGADIAH